MNIGYLKTLMCEAGILSTPSPDADWREPEEQAWRQVCALLGAKYSPYPDLIGQDPEFARQVLQECLVIPGRAPIRPRVVDPKQFLPMTPPLIDGDYDPRYKSHVRLKEDTPRHFRAKFKTITEMPASFIPRRPMVDPLNGLEPNSGDKSSRVRPVRMSPKRAARMKAAREEPVAVAVEPDKETPKTIRVR